MVSPIMAAGEPILGATLTQVNGSGAIFPVFIFWLPTPSHFFVTADSKEVILGKSVTAESKGLSLGLSKLLIVLGLFSGGELRLAGLPCASRAELDDWMRCNASVRDAPC